MENAPAEVVTDETEPNVGGSAAQTITPKERTKSKIALVFIISFILVIGAVPFVLLATKVIDVDGYKDIVLTLAGILAGPVGIIVNSYFKDGADK